MYDINQVKFSVTSLINVKTFMKNYENNDYDVGFYVNPLEEDDVLNKIYLSQQVLPSLGYLYIMMSIL